MTPFDNIHERIGRRRRVENMRRAAYYSTVLGGQIALIVAVAAQHSGWSW